MSVCGASATGVVEVLWRRSEACSCNSIHSCTWCGIGRPSACSRTRARLCSVLSSSSDNSSARSTWTAALGGAWVEPAPPSGLNSAPQSAPCRSRSAVSSRCSTIRYDAGSAFTTTRSHATPPHDHRRIACASERIRPSPSGAPALTSRIGRSPEMPKRHSRRRSHTDDTAPCARTASVRGRATVSSSAVVSDWMAASCSGLMRKLRKRMPASVADISEARLTLLACRYLSITALSVPPLSEAAVAKVSCALPCGAMRRRTDIAQTGSSPVSSDPTLPSTCAVVNEASLNVASGWLALRLRPSQCWRSVCTFTDTTCGSLSARKCAACRPCSVVSRGVRSKRSAWCSASH